MNLDPVAFLVQGGFAAAFFWLLIDTRKEAAKREDRLMGAIEKYNASLQVIANIAHDHFERR